MFINAYHIGRDLIPLSGPFRHEDKIFGGERKDDEIIENGEFAHCTFSNISFKKTKLLRCRFEDCVFLGCYFRLTEIRDSNFIGCRFFDCTFPHISIRGSNFGYSRFSNCFIPYSVMRLNLPQEPNLKEEICRNMAIETARLGHLYDARSFRMQEIKAREENWKLAMLGANEWYLEHYDYFRRFTAGIRLLRSLGNRILWGYGERIIVLICNFLVWGALIFPTLFYLNKTDLQTISQKQIDISEILYFSFSNIVPGSISSNVVAISSTTMFWAVIESLFGVIMAGLFVSYLFRWILHR